ncbi:MAG: class F sortase [Patescibacteria group bacterium]
MNLQPPLKPIRLVNNLIGIILPLVIIFVLLIGLPVYSFNKPIKIIPNKVLQPNIKQQDIKAGVPVRLKIPKIKVSIALENVGLTKEGAVGTPKAPLKAAWFNLSKRPGDIGNAVITGHYGRFKNGKLAVFNNLKKLNQGDELYVEDENGKTTIFIVRELKTYNWNERVPSIFITNDGKSHLNLITCTGAWDKASQTYLKRLVIFADKK